MTITTATHDKRCLTKMLVQALENARDNVDFENDDFTAFVTRSTNGDPLESTPYSWSMEYYSSWPEMCVCLPHRGSYRDKGWEETGVAVEALREKGWTEEAAYNHLQGMCDIEICSCGGW